MVVLLSFRTTISPPLLVVTLACLLGTRPASAQTKIGDVIGPVRETRLENGLTVVVQEDHRVPLVSLALRYQGGEQAAPGGQWAVALLATTLMLKHTMHVPAGDYDRLAARAGASTWNQRTTADYTTLTMTLPAASIALPLWLWSDQMGFFDRSIDEREWKAQRALVREQRRSTLEGSPLGRLDSFADEAMYPEGHPYRPVRTGEPVDIDGIDQAAVVAFHDQWLTPQHAILAIVGDFVSSDVRALVDRYFGSIPSGPPVTVAVPPPAVKLPGSTELDVTANVPTARLLLRWPTPALLTTDDARLDVLARLFDGKRIGWLYWALVDEAKVATSVSSHQRSRDSASEFEILIEGAPGRSAAEILAAFDAAYVKLLKRSTAPREIASARYETLVDRVMSRDNATTWANDYVRFEALAGLANNFKHDMDCYSGITPDQIRDAMERWTPLGRRVVVLVSPDPHAAPGGKLRGKRVVPSVTP